MKLKVVNAETSGPVVRRFPYLETELHEMVVMDEGFRQLCRDYKELISALSKPDTYTSDTRTDLLGLKSSLEIEILEKVSRKGARKQN